MKSLSFGHIEYFMVFFINCKYYRDTQIKGLAPLPKSTPKATSGPMTGQNRIRYVFSFTFFPFLLRPFLSRLLEPFVLTRSSNR